MPATKSADGVHEDSRDAVDQQQQSIKEDRQFDSSTASPPSNYHAPITGSIFERLGAWVSHRAEDTRDAITEAPYQPHNYRETTSTDEAASTTTTTTSSSSEDTKSAETSGKDTQNTQAASQTRTTEKTADANNNNNTDADQSSQPQQQDAEAEPSQKPAEHPLSNADYDRSKFVAISPSGFYTTDRNVSAISDKAKTMTDSHSTGSSQQSDFSAAHAPNIFSKVHDWFSYQPEFKYKAAEEPAAPDTHDKSSADSADSSDSTSASGSKSDNKDTKTNSDSGSNNSSFQASHPPASTQTPPSPEEKSTADEQEGLKQQPASSATSYPTTDNTSSSSESALDKFAGWFSSKLSVQPDRNSQLDPNPDAKPKYNVESPEHQEGSGPNPTSDNTRIQKSDKYGGHVESK